MGDFIAILYSIPLCNIPSFGMWYMCGHNAKYYHTCGRSSNGVQNTIGAKDQEASSRRRNPIKVILDIILTYYDKYIYEILVFGV